MGQRTQQHPTRKPLLCLFLDPCWLSAGWLSHYNCWHFPFLIFLPPSTFSSPFKIFSLFRFSLLFLSPPLFRLFYFPFSSFFFFLLPPSLSPLYLISTHSMLPPPSLNSPLSLHLRPSAVLPAASPTPVCVHTRMPSHSPYCSAWYLPPSFLFPSPGACWGSPYL